jgi:hypothetical protein
LGDMPQKWTQVPKLLVTYRYTVKDL